VFSVRASSRVFETSWREYLRAPSVGATVLHGAFLAGNTAPLARNLLASHHIWFDPELEDPAHLLILGGNSRLRLIDYREGTVTSILKEGFDERSIRREIALRKAGRADLAPPVLRVSEDQRSFVEPLLHGTVADRLFGRRTRTKVLLEALDACIGLAARTRRSVPLADWCRTARAKAREAVSRVEDGGSSCIRDALAWVDFLCRWLLNSDRAQNRYAETVVSHGDLQPGNVLVERDRAWLIDWENIGERVEWYDPLTLALGSRRGYPGLILRAMRLMKGEMGSEIDRTARGVLLNAPTDFDAEERIVMYLIDELQFCLGENVIGPLLTTTESLRLLVGELERSAHRLVAEAGPIRSKFEVSQ
jgi:hypothetical protein